MIRGTRGIQISCRPLKIACQPSAPAGAYGVGTSDERNGYKNSWLVDDGIYEHLEVEFVYNTLDQIPTSCAFFMRGFRHLLVSVGDRLGLSKTERLCIGYQDCLMQGCTVDLFCEVEENGRWARDEKFSNISKIRIFVQERDDQQPMRSYDGYQQGFEYIVSYYSNKTTMPYETMPHGEIDIMGGTTWIPKEYIQKILMTLPKYLSDEHDMTIEWVANGLQKRFDWHFLYNIVRKKFRVLEGDKRLCCIGRKDHIVHSMVW